MDDGLIWALISKALKGSGGSVDPDAIKAAVEDYLTRHPVEQDATKRSNNLFNIAEAQDNKAISSTTGAVSTNSGYWITGFIPVDYPFVLSQLPYRICFYDESKAFLSTVIGTAMYGVQTVPDDAAYVRIAFQKSVLPFTQADRFGVFYADDVGGFSYTKEPAYIVKPLCVTEKITEAKTYFVYNDGSDSNIIISAKVSGSGSIKFSYVYPHRTTSQNKALYESMEYPISVQSGYEIHEWRVPPMPVGVSKLNVRVTVNTNSEIDFKWLKSRFDNTVTNDGPIIHHNHFGNLAASQTLEGYVNAAKLGFKSVIMSPKLTSDGVFVAFHDDDAIGNAFRNADGSALTAEQKAKKISDFTYAQLAQFDMGSNTSSAYAGQKIARIEDIFDICAKYGMKPMFSIHGLADFDGRTSTSLVTWGQIKTMLEKRGILHMMQIKGANNTVLNIAHDVFGSDIDSYTLDWNTTGNATDSIKNLSWFDPLLCKIEFFEAYATETAIKEAVAAGITVGSAEASRTVSRMKELISWGVTEFTENEFFSFGLNW